MKKIIILMLGLGLVSCAGLQPDRVTFERVNKKGGLISYPQKMRGRDDHEPLAVKRINEKCKNGFEETNRGEKQIMIGAGLYQFNDSIDYIEFKCKS